MSRALTSASELRDWMDACNESGLDPVTAILDAQGTVWMTYGEEHSHGGEAMECWLTHGEPSNADVTGRSCDECGAAVDERQFAIRGVPLDRAAYPVTLLHDLLETHWSQRCRCGHRLDHHSGEFINGIGVCQPKPLSDAPPDECPCGGFRRAS